MIPLKKGRAQDGAPLERHKNELDKKCARGLIKWRYRIRVPGCACRPEPTETGIIGKMVRLHRMPAVAVIGDKSRTRPLSGKILGGRRGLRRIREPESLPGGA